MHPFKLSALAALFALAACGGTDEGTENAASTSSSSSSAVALPACATPTNTLHDITAVQGAGATSPLVDQLVAVRGVVTGDFQADNQLKGFFIQQAVADKDPLSSEGLFVYAPSATDIKAGDYVQVEGKVAEYKSSSDTDTLTQIASPTAITVCGSGVSMAPKTVTLPVASKAEFEALEGMLVEFKQDLSVSETYSLGRYGQLTLSSGARLYHANNHPTLNASAATAANTLNQIVLDDGSSAQNPNPIPHLSASDTSGTRRVGDMVSGVKGVLTFSANAYRVHPVTTPTFTASNARGAAPKVGGTLKVASLNVLNYFTTLGSRGANDAAELGRQKAKLVEAIAGMDADVLGLMEIENGEAALADLVAAVNTKVGAGTYAAVESGTAGTDAIKQAIIYKPARVSTVGSAQVPNDSGFAVNGGMRPPLAQRFAAVSNGGNFWLVVNHFKSKGSCPSSATDIEQDFGQGCWNASRVQQAKTLNSWVATLASASGEKDVLMVGDFNAYLKEDPITTIEAAGFEDLHYRLPATDRYTYVYAGESGVLDHAFASSSLKSQVAGFGVWHINADEPIVLDYNTEFKTDDRYAATAYRSSDHDPVLIGLNLNADAAAVVPTLSATLPASTTVGAAASITGIAAANGTSLTVDWGDGTAETLATTVTSASHSYTATGSYAIRITLKDASGQIAQKSGQITVTAAASSGTSAELFFSEYVEGSSNNKALEIYNPTGSAVDLSAYTVKLYANGGTTASNTQALSGTLAAGSTLTILNAAFTTSVTVANSITSTVTYFNGDDAITLEKSGVIVDQIGVVGEDPGTAWTTGTTFSTLDKTLRRKSSIVRGSMPATGWDISLEWDVYDKDTFAGLGSH
jgi:uncharacterized protein